MTALIDALENLKLTEIAQYDVSKISPLTDQFLIASADSMTQIDGARNRILEIMHPTKLRLKNPNEDWKGGWLIMDYGDIIINIFLNETRSFYNLDNFIKAGKIDLDELRDAVGS